MNKILSSIKYLKFKDLVSVFIFLFVLIPSQIYRLYLKIINKKIWLICENPETARDNGYHFFIYMMNNHENITSYYAIDKKSYDYKKIEQYKDNIIQFYSLKHWILYLSCDKNISSQKSGNPSPALFYILHVKLNLFNNRVFLQHGIAKDDMPFLHYKETKFKKFICGAKAEYEYINKSFGYPDGYVIYTGISRFDNLNNKKSNKKEILLMPTWRNWLGRDTNIFENTKKFKKSKFYIRYNSLLNNKKLINYIEKSNIILNFYPHRNMHKFLNYFNIESNCIKILSEKDIDIQDLLINSSLMITDYSSVAMDFAYMKKPVIYYHFDYSDYRKKQLPEGYFSYEKDGFGKIINDEDELVEQIIKVIENDYCLDKKYYNRIKKFFTYDDGNNSKRIYEEILGDKK